MTINLISLLLSLLAPPAATAAWADRAGDVPRLQGLGAHARKVTTTSSEAQSSFDQGLALLFAFNHDEAIRSFRKATELDPSCPMAWWGLAVAPR